MATAGNGSKRRVLRLGLLAATLAGGCNAVFGIHEGTPPPPCYDPGPAISLLIDDMEDGMGDICALGGRRGYWYTAGDGTSTALEPAQGTHFTPAVIPGGRGKSHYAARFTGSGFIDWGALLGLTLNGQSTSRATYDASGTSGITFWMRSDVPVSLTFLIPETLPVDYGGDCVASATNPNCNNPFSFMITAPSTDWVQYYVPFSAVTQQYGGTATWNPKLLIGFQFEVGPGAAFDVWVDDISFYYCATGACRPTCNDPAFPVSCAKSGSHPAACLLQGNDCSAIVTWCSDPLLIDDMEDGDSAICDSGGRSGAWFTVADGTEGTLSPAHTTAFTMTSIPGGRGDSHAAARMMASGFTTWAQMGLDFNQAYDSSAHGGITFWMKTDAPNVAVGLPTSQTNPVSRGGLCPDNRTPNNCYDEFLFEITSPHPGDWFQYRVPFSALFQAQSYLDANGNLMLGSATWDPTHLAGVKFTVNQPPPTFEIWIDDVSFYDCSKQTCLPTCSDPRTPMACPALGTTPASCWPAGTNCSTVSQLLWHHALAAIGGSGPDDVWAVGPNYQGPSAVTIHWDGSAWSSSAAGSANPLWDIWESKKDDVWAVGDLGTAVHWNGVGWSPSTTGTQASLNSVWSSGVDDTDIWAAGANGTILHFDGTTWSPNLGISSKALYRLWGSSSSDVWAVGDAGTILHYDGNMWSASASGTDSILSGVWGSSSTDVYVVGNTAIGYPTILHWDRRSFAMAALNIGTAIGYPTILHWDGAAWSPVSTQAAPYPNAVWGSGRDDVWVVGTSILHWDGKNWLTVPSPTTDYLNAIWGSGPSDAWIVGRAGTILHWDGTSWSVLPIGGFQ